MKNLIKYNIIALLLIVGIVSCTKDTHQGKMELEEGITLTLKCASPDTRATIDGVTDLNENKIENVYYFFYPENPSDPSADNLAQDPVFWGKMKGLNSQNQQVIRLNYTEYNINYEIFPRPFNTCDVYVVANIPEGIIENLPDRKYETIRAIALSADFGTTLTQDKFVMEGLGTAEIVDRKNIIAATGTIPIDRVASKISVRVMVAESVTPIDNEIDVNGRTWTSEPESMKIEFVNGVNNAVLSGDPTAVAQFSTFATDKNSRVFNDDNSDQLWECQPFYSYPSKWDIGGESEPYLRITMPWKTIINTEVDGQQRPVTEYRNCYYKVILGGDMLKRNTWYDLTVNIGILGSFDEQEEILIPLSNITYYVQDWSTGLNVESNILSGRYLVVNKVEYEIYTQDELRIPFTTSHTCEIVDMSTVRVNNQATITYPDYSNSTPNENAPVAWNNTSWYLQIENSEIVFKHKLRNDISAGKGNYDYAAYTIKFRIRHSDSEGKEVYYKDITIKQYPAMIIQCKPNRKINNNGGVSVNNGSNYGGVHGLTGSGNQNPNMYVIQTSVLPANSEYILGDPRSQIVNNLNNNNWSNAKGIENLTGNNRKLQNYYPTLTDEATRSIIAPKFRIASSYGVTNAISYTNAQYRCASYQEDGYPAGRWRLPTLSEVAFIAKLSADNVIPTLFSNGSEYWCAGGTVEPDTDGSVTPSYSTGGSTYVRCVYDEWYWELTRYPRLPGETVTFTWGDSAR